jgi:hypothetical protein
VSAPHIIYVPRPDATPEAELNALAAVYRFILDDCRERKKAAPASRPKQPERTKDDPARAILHQDP